MTRRVLGLLPLALALLPLDGLPACSVSHPYHPPVGCVAPLAAAPNPAPHGVLWPTFHGDRARTGWNSRETILTPDSIAAGSLALRWESPELDEVGIDGTAYAPHAYASPLYADDLAIASCGGQPLSVVFVATSNGYVYAVNAFDASVGSVYVAAGTLLWRAALAPATVIPRLDGGVPLGTLSTPVLDLQASPPRLYVTAADGAAWKAYALDATTGTLLSGWPVTIDNVATRSVNGNGPAEFLSTHVLSQRGALNLSADGGTLYIPFGAYSDGGVGWMVAVSTAPARVEAAFSSAPSTAATAYGGIWSAGGAAIDEDGFVYAATGNAPGGLANAAHVWGESLLQWRAPLVLTGTYTPFNYCALDDADIDIGGASPLVVADLDPATSATPKLLATGGKQGNIYLVDRTHLNGSLDTRPPCGSDSTRDGSLLAPEPQPQFGARGPLNVFGPYTDKHGDADFAKMRTTPAAFRATGATYLFVSGASKANADSTRSVPPSVARLHLVIGPGTPAYLALDKTNATLAFRNPGSPLVTSHGEQGPVVWVLDENASRHASLVDPATPRPILYAIDGTTLTELWNSGGALHLGGKYATPVVAHGTVFVVTDRVQAFSLTR